MLTNSLRIALLTGVVWFNPAAYADTFLVADATGLINAINTSNGNGENDTIMLDADITLTAVNNANNGLPIVDADNSHTLTLEGNGQTVARDGTAPAFRIIEVAENANLTLNRVTLANGNAAAGGGGILTNGGALYSASP